MASSNLLFDSHGRILRDLRISVTDRCNFRCLYCLPETEAAEQFYRGRWADVTASVPITREWMPRTALLTFEEIERVARLFAGLGIQKIRLTGGEPLLRRDLPSLVRSLAVVAGIEDLALTSNGFLFAPQALALREAGLQRISFSLDSLDRENFRRITGRDALAETVAAIDLAVELGFSPVKVNAVVIRGLNDHEVEALAAFARQRRLAVRFIEFMPLDSRKAWQRELVVPGGEILSRLQARFALEPAPSANPSATARRWRFSDGTGEIGIIAPVTEPFCGHCNRVRLTADGQIRTCLFSVVEHDLRGPLRNGADDETLRQFIRAIVLQKEDRHHIGEPQFVPPQRPMNCIGG
jgi:cyclic pyranopterin phosphate synthase